MIEMIAVISILSIVLAVVYQGMISLNQTAASTDLRLDNLGEARGAMEVITRDLRTATRPGSGGLSPFLVAKDKEVEWYANLDPVPGPRKVRIYVDAQNNLIEEVIPPGGTAPNWTYTGTPEVAVRARWVANSGAQPIFVYYDPAGLAIATPVANTLRIDAVGVNLAIRKPSKLPEKATTLTNRVRLPNVDYNPLPSP